LSAFLIDLNQVALAVHSATARSLVLMDEFGKVAQLAFKIGLPHIG
jgi:DNA mismatch repair ATPase MutS